MGLNISVDYKYTTKSEAQAIWAFHDLLKRILKDHHFSVWGNDYSHNDWPNQKITISFSAAYPILRKVDRNHVLACLEKAIQGFIIPPYFKHIWAS